MSMLRSVKPTEYQIQCSIIEYANKWRLPDNRMLGDYLFHIPNGGLRNKVEAIKLKKMGVKAGVWDLFLALPSFSDGFDFGFIEKCGMFIEVKSPTGTLTKNQKEFELTHNYNYSFLVVNRLESFVSWVSTYLRL